MTSPAQTTRPPGRRRRRDPEATREAILDAAEELFVVRGPSDTPTSEIGRRAGVTKSLIHHHFGSKEELWTEVKRRRFQRYYDAQKQMLTSPGATIDILRQSMIAYFRFLQDDPAAVRFMGWRFVEEDDPCLALEQDLFELGVVRLREAQERGELRDDVEPISIIKGFLGLCLHWFQSRPFLCQMHERLFIPCGDPSHCDAGQAPDLKDLDERYLEDVLRIFMDGIQPR